MSLVLLANIGAALRVLGEHRMSFNYITGRQWW
jgi:hypothetical protein